VEQQQLLALALVLLLLELRQVPELVQVQEQVQEQVQQLQAPQGLLPLR